MTLSTTVRILESDADTRDIFLKMREIIGIPEGHPYEDDGHRLISDPGGFMSYLCVSGSGTLSEEELSELAESGFSIGPKAWVTCVSLDTAYCASVPGIGRSAAEIHNYIIARLSAAFPDMVFAAHNEFDDTWHYNALPY